MGWWADLLEHKAFGGGDVLHLQRERILWRRTGTTTAGTITTASTTGACTSRWSYNMLDGQRRMDP